MWMDIDEGIRSRIKNNIIKTAQTRALLFALLLLVVGVVILASFNVTNPEGATPSIFGAVLAFVGIGLIAIFYILFTTIREQSSVIDSALYMVVGTISSKVDTNILMVKIPGEKDPFKVSCDADMYSKAAINVRVLVVAASKKNSIQMYGVDPAVYDKDGVL